MEQLIILGFIINITGMIILVMLSLRQLEKIEGIAGRITFTQDEEGHTRAVLKPEKAEQRSTNIFKNRQKKIENRKNWR